MVYGGGLENPWPLTGVREFESLTLRKSSLNIDSVAQWARAFFLRIEEVTGLNPVGVQYLIYRSCSSVGRASHF